MSFWRRRRIKRLIYELTDVSHAAARRYSANILLSNNPTKPSIIQAIKEITGYLKEKDKNPVQVVSLFVYLSIEDIQNADWICRSQWVDDKLPAQFAPRLLEGNNIGNGIVVDWID